MTSAKLATGFISIAIALTVPATGRAQTCASDADCGKGLRCLANPIATTPVAICYDGDAGGVCKPIDQPPPTPTSSCQAAACTIDADCGTDMICHQQVSTTCTGGGTRVKCDPTTGCDPTLVPPDDPVTCTETVSGACAYRWEMPCNADTDCGSNFTCQARQWTMCSGSSGTANVGGGTSSGVGGGAGTPAPMPPVPVDGGATVSCTSGSSYPGNCVAKPIACAVTADCPADWTCTAASTGTGVAGAPTATGGSGGSVPMPVDAGVAVPPPVPTPASSCQPPSTHGTYVNRGGTDTSQGGTSGTVSLVADAGAKGSPTPPTPTVPGTQNGPTTQEQTPARTPSGGGCSLAGTGGDALWLLGLLGVALIALRRRVA